MSGKLFIFSAPSGSGKTSIVLELMKSYPNLGFSISATTRSPRSGETHGKHYYFLDPKDFHQKVENNEFAEWEEVYAGTSYGTLHEEIQRLWDEGKDVLFDVDVVGGINLQKAYAKQAISIFVKVPDLKTLENRLRSRGTETEESLAIRLEKVKEELTYQDQFDYKILNDELSNAVSQAKLILEEHA